MNIIKMKNNMKKKKNLIPLEPWFDSYNFLGVAKHLQWYITNDHRLLDEIHKDLREDIDDLEIIKTFWVYHPAPNQETYFMRKFCNEFHSEIDFDNEFRTQEPGAFERYHEKFGNDYEDYEFEHQFSALVNELAQLGYRIE